MKIKLTKKEKKVVKKAVISGVLLIMGYFLKRFFALQLLAFVSAYMVIGFDVLKKSAKNIVRGQLFDENFLMSLATLGAISIGEYGEAVFVMLFYKIGELFESIAVGKSRKSIADLMNISPDYANLEKDGEIVLVLPEKLQVGDIVVVKPGEKVPADGVVIYGESNLDTANMTGESVPRFVGTEDRVVSGCINIDGVLRIRVTKEFKDSTVSKVIDLVENASSRKSVSETFITKFAKYYTPIVVISAVALAAIPSVCFGNWQMWLHRALVFLVVSCPCALVISVPLSFFCSIGCASKKGVLIKGSNYIETLSKCKSMVFDKTGTLTMGELEVSEVLAMNCSQEELLELAAHAEHYSTHPIAISICKAYDGEVDKSAISDICEIAGQGIKMKFKGRDILVGNEALFRNEEIAVLQNDIIGTTVHIAVDNKYSGCIVVTDKLKETSKSAVVKLRRCGIETVAMLSGDKESVAQFVGEELGLDYVCSELLPSEKVASVEKLMGLNKHKLAYVGDGVNDAPVISRADVGIAMGAMGSDAAIEAADIVLMDDSLEKIPFAIRLSKKTMSIVKQNIVFALSVKFFVLALSIFGLSNMWQAVFADVGVSVIAILNAMRLLNYKNS